MPLLPATSMMRRHALAPAAATLLAAALFVGCARGPAPPAADRPAAGDQPAASDQTAAGDQPAAALAAAAATTPTEPAAAASPAADTPATPTAPAEVATLLELVLGDRACYVHLATTAGDRSLEGDFELCAGGLRDATTLVGQRVTWTTRRDRVQAASCEGNPDCTASDEVDLVVSLTAAP